MMLLATKILTDNRVRSDNSRGHFLSFQSIIQWKEMLHMKPLLPPVADT